MNVKELRDLIALLPGDTLLVVDDNDHAYRRADAGIHEAVNYVPSARRGHLGMYYGSPKEIDRSETPEATIIKVLVVT